LSGIKLVQEIEMAKFIAVDIGMTNIDLVVEMDSILERRMLANRRKTALGQLRQALRGVEEFVSPGMTIGVTGGRYRDLPKEVDGFQILKVDEMLALGRGGLAMTNLKSGLVVSAGTGVAMVSAAPDGIEHVTGSAVGGGTLLGLSKLILGTDDVSEIDDLAMAGDASAVDIMLTEAVGGQIGRLPSKANAVNLGKLDRQEGFTQENLAAGLVRLVAQVIAVIAINASNASGLEDMILLGHLMDLKSIRKEIELVGEFYGRTFTVPDYPGFGTVMGVLEVLKDDSNNLDS
jgi:type II pantothenate kinase